MANSRIRSIKPEFLADEKMAPLDVTTRFVFIGLICMADDCGRLLDNIRLIDASIFPETGDTAREALATLSRINRISFGKTSSGQKVIQILNWDKHQKIDRPNFKAALPPITYEETTCDNSRVIREDVENDSRVIREPYPRPTTYDLRPTIRDQESGTATLSASADPPAENSPAPKASPSPSEFLAAWNSEVPFAPIRSMSGKRAEALRVRRTDPDWERDWRPALAKIRGSPFLRGENPRGWKANVDWFLRPDTFTKILEGMYDGAGRDQKRDGRCDDDDHLQRALASIQHFESDAGED